MNQASNASGTTHTTMTVLDTDNGSASISIGGGSSFQSNGDVSNDDHADVSSQTSMTPSVASFPSTPSSTQSGSAKIFNYKSQSFTEHDILNRTTCEETCVQYCREFHILPTTRLLFSLRVHDTENEWVVPGHCLRPGVRYNFRMRFKVPSMDTHLYGIDPNAYEYLYRQMRYDMVSESIPEIRYPAKKDNVMGLAVVDMYIDLLEQRDSAQQIEKNYKRYLPRKLLKAHKYFVRSKICGKFRQFRTQNIDLGSLKWHYVHEVCTLAPNYLMEMYVCVVSHIPNDEQTISNVSRGVGDATTRNGVGTDGFSRLAGPCVCVRIDTYDNPEPGMKISREKLKWTLVSRLENIYAMYIESGHCVCLEITGFPNSYRMQFERKTELESFITYLSGYIRLTSKWMMDLCAQYPTPSLVELNKLRCHGPVGGNFSFAKIHEKLNKCGSCIIRQCEKEYDVYYIDINTRALQNHSLEKYKTETFKITRDKNNEKWILYFNEKQEVFNTLQDLVHFIPIDASEKFRLPPSEYDKPPLLLICLPKKLQSKKTETELSEAELQNKRVQIFNPRTDLQWYKKTERFCDNGKMVKMRADWIQEGSYKDVSVTLKVLVCDNDYKDFTALARTWSQINSPHFLKLYGITLITPYTMIMEHAKYGALNEFLTHHKEKITVIMLLSVVHDLVRGIRYLQECNIYHGFIRCANLFVTKFDPKSDMLEAKIGDPGFPRSYSKEDLPWIPFEYYTNVNKAHGDMCAELWAFATTVWEIFARGQPPSSTTAEALSRNYHQLGGILPMPSEDCPDKIYQTILDGWNMEADRRFDHQVIFARLSAIKERCVPSYETCNNELLSENSSLHSEYSETGTVNGLHNGHSLTSGDMEFSNNSTTCDRAPLIHNQHIQRMNSQPFGMSNKRSFFNDTPSVLQVPQGKIIFQKKIGEGHYGVVYLGEMRYNSPNKACEKVAIKTLKPLGPKQSTNDFKREIGIMQKLDHPNVVKIKYSVGDPISIIMEYLECGSFIVYLSSRKPNLTNLKLLHFALDIAKGMDYLRSENVIHRDLAARNILVDTDRVKISDFGLAQIANSEGYYLVQSDREIPIKWYSPETINTGKFSFQSDVWSYGVTLFEMFSRGETPDLDPTKKELKQDEFLERLERGDRLAKPTLCPDIVYDKLMRPCWDREPKKRPTFGMLIDKIQSIIIELSGESI